MVSIDERNKCNLCGSAKFITSAEGFERIKKRLCNIDCKNNNEIILKKTKTKFAKVKNDTLNKNKSFEEKRNEFENEKNK